MRSPPRGRTGSGTRPSRGRRSTGSPAGKPARRGCRRPRAMGWRTIGGAADRSGERGGSPVRGKGRCISMRRRGRRAGRPRATTDRARSSRRARKASTVNVQKSTDGPSGVASIPAMPTRGSMLVHNAACSAVRRSNSTRPSAYAAAETASTLTRKTIRMPRTLSPSSSVPSRIQRATIGGWS